MIHIRTLIIKAQGFLIRFLLYGLRDLRLQVLVVAYRYWTHPLGWLVRSEISGLPILPDPTKAGLKHTAAHQHPKPSLL